MAHVGTLLYSEIVCILVDDKNKLKGVVSQKDVEVMSRAQAHSLKPDQVFKATDSPKHPFHLLC